MERMPAPEIRSDNTVLGEPAPKKGKTARKAAPPKKSAQQDLLDILGGGGEEEKTDRILGSARAGDKNAELLKDLFGSGPSTNGGAQPSPARSNVSDIMDLFGQGSIPVSSPSPAMAVSGVSTTAFDDLFGRSEAPTPPRQQTTPSYRKCLFVGLC